MFCFFIVGTFFNDYIVGHQFFNDAAQFTVILPGSGSKQLCYGIYGTRNTYYNIISEKCTSVNILFTEHPVRNNENRISTIGIHSVTGDNETRCADIQINRLGCSASINNSTISMSRTIGNITVRKFNNRWRVSVPNCERPHTVMWITCNSDMLRFDVIRGLNINRTSHGLLGKTFSHIVIITIMQLESMSE